MQIVTSITSTSLQPFAQGQSSHSAVKARRRPSSLSPNQPVARPDLPFSKALAVCRPPENVLSCLCAVAKLPLSYTAVETAWPWVARRVKSPCECHIVHPSVLMTLCHLYDSHVVDRQQWSLPELREWIEQVQYEIAEKFPSAEDLLKRKKRGRPTQRFVRKGPGKAIRPAVQAAVAGRLA